MLSAIKKGILTSARSLGYEITKAPRYKEEYESVYPVATYSPWNISPAFRETFNQISDHTLVDIYRCWELWCLVEQSTTGVVHPPHHHARHGGEQPAPSPPTSRRGRHQR